MHVSYSTTGWLISLRKYFPNFHLSSTQFNVKITAYLMKRQLIAFLEVTSPAVPHSGHPVTEHGGVTGEVFELSYVAAVSVAVISAGKKSNPDTGDVRQQSL